MRKLRLSAAAIALSAAIWFLTPLRAGRNDSDPIGLQAADAAPARIERVAPGSVGFDPVRLGRVDEAVGRAIDDGQAPGAVVCVVRHGRVALLRAYGNRRTVPDTVAMSEDTIFIWLRLPRSRPRLWPSCSSSSRDGYVWATASTAI